MATPVHIQPSVFFYPVGNTPAVCLTESIPPDQDAALLLLGCGDARSILFTCYAGLGHENRKLDFTCCDMEHEVIGRNITLFTLLVDDVRDDNIDQIWNLYYHVYTDDETLSLLRKHSSKLMQIASSADEWNDGKYGKFLRFSDNYTFSQVHRLWEFYSARPSHGASYDEQQSKLNRAVKKAKDMQERVVCDQPVITGLRSAAPCAVKAASDMPHLYSKFWKTGTTITGDTPSTLHKQLRLNPMFGTLDTALLLHYGTSPLDGFHLASTYTPIAPQSPLKPELLHPHHISNNFKVALTHFKEYAKAFRAALSRVTVRFVNAEALAFCHTLQHLGEYGDSRSAWWYRKLRSHTPLILDSQDYATTSSQAPAPLKFDVIDTSNLMDHIGCLNLFAATSPLLRPTLTSTLATEMLVLRDIGIEENTQGLLLGDLPTAASLFGLVSTQYWTGVGAPSSLDDRLINMISARDKIYETQSRYICLWRTLNFGLSNMKSGSGYLVPSVTFHAIELASFINQLYLKMFEIENLMNTLQLTAEKYLKRSDGHYTRTSLVALLALIRKLRVEDWNLCMNEIYRHVITDSSLSLGRHSIQELLVQLSLLDLHRLPDIDAIMSETLSMDECFLRNWSFVPRALAVTMVIPREKLLVFEDNSEHRMTPIAHIRIQRTENLASGSESIFSDIHLGFGMLKTSGTKHTENYKVEIEDDDKQWEGTSPLIVSTVIPSYLVFLDKGLSTNVSFGLHPTPKLASKFIQKLGVELVISRSTFASNDVFITKHRPNMAGHKSLSGMAAIESVHERTAVRKSSNNPSTAPDKEEAKVAIHMTLTSDCSCIASMTTRVDILEGKYQEILRSGAEVRVLQISPFEISIKLGTVTAIKRLHLPAPVQMTGSKTRIARKSSFVEFITPVSPQKSLSNQPGLLYTITMGTQSPRITNMPYISLNQLPILDLKNTSMLSWLTTHLSDMFSARERKEREKHSMLPSPSDDLRVNYKDSLFSLFMHFTGVRGDRRYPRFGLNCAAQGGVNMIILPTYLRLDMSSQSVVLDAAVIPLTTEDMHKLFPMIQKLQKLGLMSIRVDESELRLWKHALPTLVERCRDWKHSSSCEYHVNGKIPIATDFGKQVICSCGKGKFPKGYKVDETTFWKDIAPHAVRVAISPCFPVPFVDKPVDFLDLRRPIGSLQSLCHACGKRETDTTNPLLKCGGCKAVSYCSKDCQKIDWKRGHKDRCKALRE